MPAHVEHGGRAELGGGEALVELGGCEYLVHQLLRNHLALVIDCVEGKQLRLEGPVFVELGEHLHKVALHRGAAY